jgi:hypothetical protein
MAGLWSGYCERFQIDTDPLGGPATLGRASIATQQRAETTPFDNLALTLRLHHTAAVVNAAGGSGAVRVRVLLCIIALALASCAADATDHAAPMDQPDDEDTALATLRARQIARDVAAIVEGMRMARLSRLIALGRKA